MDDPDHPVKVRLVREWLRRQPDINLFEWAFDCPEMEAAILEVARSLEPIGSR